MKRKIKRLFAKAFDRNAKLKVRLFRMMLLLGEAAFFLATISNVVLGTGLMVTCFSAAACLLLVIGFLLSMRLQDCTNLITGVILMVNMLLLPITLMSSGGFNSGASVWLAFGLVLVFMFLDGVRFYVTLGISVCSMISAYAVQVSRSVSVVSQRTERAELYSSCISILLVGILIGMIVYFQRRMYEREWKVSEEQRRTIQQLSDSRSQFFANMSHEIRTPINTIIGLNEMTLREDISAEVAENAVNIQNASKILLALINDILDLSKIESGKMEIVPVQYETSALFSDLVNLIWLRAHEKKLEFLIDISEDIPSVLYGDEVRIKQILVNLLTNAVKYTREGSVSLTVRGEKLDSNRICLKMAVRDTGIGIKSEDMDQLFSAFQRVDVTSNRKIEGTGLGLAISRQLAEMMGGTIMVDSIYTRGSVFTLTLEQQIISGKPLGSMRYAVQQSLKDRVKYERSFEAPEAKVLVVDDNEMNRLVARKLLRDTRVQVELAASGKECLQKTLDQKYHVIFMDHIMPEMDGEATLKALRSRKEGYCQDTPVIALTANVMPNAFEWYREKGFDGYLAKPLSGAVFEAVLQQYLPEELIVYRSEKAEHVETAERVSAMMRQEKTKTHIRITTDCVCDLPEDLLQQYGIGCMYYYITTGEGHFRDGTEIAAENLLDYMDQGNEAVSGPASVEEYERFFGGHLMEAEQVIHISMAAGASKGFETASRAAQGFGNVRVLDSGHLSGGLGLIVLQAAKLASEGADAEEICSCVEKLREKAVTSFIVKTSANLYRSGRMSRNLYLFGHVLSLHPVLALRHGRILPVKIYVGNMDAAARHYIRHMLRAPKKIDENLLFVIYAGCNVAQLEMIRREIDKCMQFREIRFRQATASIASNCGIGAFGLLYLRKRDSDRL